MSTAQSASQSASRVPGSSVSGNLGVNSVFGQPVLLLHLVALLLHVPLLTVYFKELWSQPHYQFFPIVFLFVGYVIWSRLPEMKPLQFRADSITGNFFLIAAIPFVLFSNLTFDVDIASIGCFLIAASLLARTKSVDGSLSLLPLVFPLAIAVRLPFGYDILMISRLQQWTSVISSRLLDVLGIIHMRNGNTIGLPTKQFFVEEACSGVQSLFTLLFFSLAWVVWNHRGWFHATLLVMSAVFWAGFSNTLRVVSICVGEQWMGVDLVAEPAHMILGYACLIISMLLLVSTDFFLTFIMNSGTPTADDTPTLGQRLMGRKKTGKKNQAKAAAGVFSPSRLLVLGVCGVFSLVALVPILRAGPSVFFRELTQKYVIGEIGSHVMEPQFQTQSASEKPASWKVTGFEHEERELNSDWGSRSSRWTMVTDAAGIPMECQFSCDYPFNGWHELSICYRGNGWTMNSRTVKTVSGYENWPVVMVDLENRNGSHALLLFSLFDEQGNAIRTPGEDVLRLGFVGRVIHLIQQRVSKQYGPRPQTYQVQAFFPGFRGLKDAEKDDLLTAYVQLRAKLLDAVVNDRAAPGAESASSSSLSESTTPAAAGSSGPAVQ